MLGNLGRSGRMLRKAKGPYLIFWKRVGFFPGGDTAPHPPPPPQQTPQKKIIKLGGVFKFCGKNKFSLSKNSFAIASVNDEFLEYLISSLEFCLEGVNANNVSSFNLFNNEFCAEKTARMVKSKHESLS